MKSKPKGTKPAAYIAKARQEGLPARESLLFLFPPTPPRSPYHLLRLGVMPQLQAHVREALNMGVTDEQLAAIPEALKAVGLDAEALRCEAAIAAVKGESLVVSPSTPPNWKPTCSMPPR